MDGDRQVIKGLVEAFKEKDLLGYVVALTHTAVSNVTTADIVASTLLAFLHRNVKRKQLMAIIVDECSQIPLSMQSILMELKFMGHIIVQMGDPQGQFLPIPDSNRHHMVQKIDTSDFMHDMCNGLHITMQKFRRGDDMEHFDFVGSLYNMKVNDALIYSLFQYDLVPSGDARPKLDSVTLTVSHRKRIQVNDLCNRLVKPMVEDASRFLDVDAIVSAVPGVNQPQSVWLHRGLIMQAFTPKTDANLKNGMKYLLLDFTVEDGVASYQFEGVDEFGHRRQHNYLLPIKPSVPDKSFWMSEGDVLRKMRLTFAVTYFSAQAATIRQPLRLEDLKHPHFTTRHLIVGLGRAPLGRLVQLVGRR